MRLLPAQRGPGWQVGDALAGEQATVTALVQAVLQGQFVMATISFMVSRRAVQFSWSSELVWAGLSTVWRGVGDCLSLAGLYSMLFWGAPKAGHYSALPGPLQTSVIPQY